MIDIKKYICLFILNNFGIYDNYFFKNSKFLLNSKIKSDSKDIDIFGLRFEKDDFYINVYISETLENNEEYHCLLDIMGRQIGLAYSENSNHSLITYLNPSIKELDFNQILTLCSSFNYFRELKLEPNVIDIEEPSLKMFKEYINHSLTLINLKE